MNDLVHMHVDWWNQHKPRIYAYTRGPFGVKSSYLNKEEMRGKCNNSLENTQSSSPGAGFKRKKALWSIIGGEWQATVPQLHK